MSLTVVSANQLSSTTSGAVSVSTSNLFNNNTGDLNVILFTNQVANNISSIVDAAGNTYLPASAEQNYTANFWNCYYAFNVPSYSNNVILISFSTSSVYVNGFVYKISGADLTNPLGNYAFANSDPMDSGNIVVTAVEEVILALGIGTPVITPGTGYTGSNFGVVFGDPTPYWIEEYKIVTASESATASGSGGGLYGVSFKGAASGGGGKPYLYYANQRKYMKQPKDQWKRNDRIYVPSYYGKVA